ncbi:MAG: hypothetical protein ACO2ZZ_09780 [Cyclobacteriaceae bacterium]
MIRLTFVFLLILYRSIGYAQSPLQDYYLEAKRLYHAADYTSADAAFLELNDDLTFGPYADFYRGLIQYRQGKIDQSILLWKKLLTDYPNWEKQLEVLYWLSVSHFQVQDFDNGLTYLDTYTDKSVDASLSDQLIAGNMKDLPLSQIEGYQKRYPALRSLAYLTAIKINQEPTGKQDRDYLKKLIDEYSLPIQSVMNLEVENEKKSHYDIGVVLPFVFSGLDNTVAILRNNLVMDLYQGMQMAKEELQGQDINIRIHSFDTQKDSTIVMSFEEDLSSMDLLLGPLYPGPIEALKVISQKYQINMISPLTSNSSYADGNPFAFLAKPSYETMARHLADYVLKQNHKKTAFIYFSKDSRDSLFAEAYKEQIQDSIFIWDFQSVDDLIAKRLLDSLTEQYEYYYPKSVADSIAEIEGRYIKFRSLREEEKENEQLDSLAFFELNENGNIADPDEPNRLLAYEMKFRMPLDTVGHILIASRSMSHYNNFVSAKAARQDSIGIYGYSNWFDNRLVNYELMDEVDATVAVAGYYKKDSYAFEEFSKKVMNRYLKPASDYHVQGYDLMMYLGNLLSKNGKYFQFGAFEEGYNKGYLTEGYDFSGTPDNQAVPLLIIEEFEIQKAN